MALTLAIVGTLLICLGSFVGIQAPRDGQTGMVVFPAWFIGGALILGVFLYVGPSRTILAMSAISIASVVWCLWASR